MARQFTDGAEIGDVLFWSVIAGSVTNITTTPRSGVRTYSVSNATGTRNITAVAEGYDRRGIFMTSIGTVHTLFRWTKAGTVLGGVRLNATTAKLEIYTGTATLVATSANSLLANTWYLLETHVKIDDSVGLIEVRIDGIDFVSFSGDTKPGADTTFDAVVATTGITFYLDDLAFNDTTGGVDDSWCGDGKIVMLPPSSAGDTTQWTPSAGSNWQNADDVPPDGDTTYNSENTSGDVDLYNTMTFTIPANHVVKSVYTEARTREETAAGDSLQYGLKTNGVEYWDAGQAQLTSYQRYVGTRHRVNPQTLVTWIQGELDGLQVGVKIP